MTIERLIEYGSLTQEIANKLEVLVKAKYNIFYLRRNGIRKTTFFECTF